MLSNKKIVCPNNLINIAKKSGKINAAIVNAGEMFPMESVHKAVEHNLINPIFIGNESEIKKYGLKSKLKCSFSNIDTLFLMRYKPSFSLVSYPNPQIEVDKSSEIVLLPTGIDTLFSKFKKVDLLFKTVLPLIISPEKFLLLT